MKTNTQPSNPTRPEEPMGDLGHGHKTWTPDSGEQGISNRPDDEVDAVPDGDQEEDDAAFNSDEDDEVEDGSEDTGKP